ncbi:hypothetical protein K3725_21650 (plasmid) [Leisingera sp. S132]|nr:hypothetical protein K3725_21650 [Leisingera sp. S132]
MAFPQTRPAAASASAPAAKPNRHDDSYAGFVLNTKVPELGSADTSAILGKVADNVSLSRGYLANQRTADAINSTLAEALEKSPTFRHTVSFASSQGLSDLGKVLFQTVYEPTDGGFIDDIELGDVYEAYEEGNPLPIMNVAEACERDIDGETRHAVNIGIAPNSEQFPAEYRFWQECLVHELTHHLCDSGDPNDSTSLGPTELLARQVAAEAGWGEMPGGSYNDPARTSAMTDRNTKALIAALGSHDAPMLFDRLKEICADAPASSALPASDVSDSESDSDAG